MNSESKVPHKINNLKSMAINHRPWIVHYQPSTSTIHHEPHQSINLFNPYDPEPFVVHGYKPLTTSREPSTIDHPTTTTRRMFMIPTSSWKICGQTSYHQDYPQRLLYIQSPGSRFSILDSSILDSRFFDSRLILDSSILDSWLSILDSRFSILRFSILDSSFLDSSILDFGSRFWILRFSTNSRFFDSRFFDSRFSILRFSILDSRFFDSRFFDSRFSVLRFSILDSSILDSRFFDSPILDSSILDSSILDSSILDSSTILDSTILDSSILDSLSPAAVDGAVVCIWLILDLASHLNHFSVVLRRFVPVLSWFGWKKYK